MKICVFATSRTNYGRLKPLIKAIQADSRFKLQLVYCCSFYNAVNEFEPDYRIQALLSGDDTEAMAITSGLLLTKVTDVLKVLKPDLVYIRGDRYEILPIAIAAAYMNIKLAHEEGGEDTGTIDDKVRYAVTALADIHFPATTKAATRLLNTGATNVHIVGCTGLDNLVNIDLSNNRDKPYIVILCHPNTTDAEDITALIEAVKQIDIHKVWVNPNVDAGSKAILKQIHKQEVEFVKDLPPEEYARLINNAQCCVGNSSSFIKEGAFLGTPAVIVGERQHNREHGKNVLFANNATIAQSIKRQIAHGKYQKDYIFGNGKACEKILEVLNDISNNSGTKRLKEG